MTLNLMEVFHYYIKNDFKDIRTNFIRKGARKYRALKVFLRGIFTILNFFFKTKKCLYNSFFYKRLSIYKSTIWGTYMKLVTKYQISAINSC
jgi:hypothetical protein